MKIDQFVDEFNHLEQKDKTTYIANLQKKADNGDMSALFLTGYLQIPPDWEVMKKAISAEDPELYYAYICARTVDFGISPAKAREIHQLCYRGRKMNYAPILNWLAITYLCGIGCKQNVQLAKKYFTQAAELCLPEAVENLNCMERETPDFWAEHKYMCLLSSELNEVLHLDRSSIRIFGTLYPGKTTLAEDSTSRSSSLAEVEMSEFCKSVSSNNANSEEQTTE